MLKDITFTRVYTIYIQVKSFLNYFASKMILLNILQTATIYLFKYFALHIMEIAQK